MSVVCFGPKPTSARRASVATACRTIRDNVASRQVGLSADLSLDLPAHVDQMVEGCCSDICSAHIRRPGGIAHRFIQHAGRLSMPTIVLAELYAGAYMLDVPDRILTGIDELRKDMQALDFDETCAEEFGKLRGWLNHHGIQRNAVDLMIAAVARAHDLTLVTHNTQHFQNIPNLRLDDWLVP